MVCLFSRPKRCCLNNSHLFLVRRWNVLISIFTKSNLEVDRTKKIGHGSLHWILVVSKAQEQERETTPTVRWAMGMDEGIDLGSCVTRDNKRIHVVSSAMVLIGIDNECFNHQKIGSLI